MKRANKCTKVFVYTLVSDVQGDVRVVFFFLKDGGGTTIEGHERVKKFSGANWLGLSLVVGCEHCLFDTLLMQSPRHAATKKLNRSTTRGLVRRRMFDVIDKKSLHGGFDRH